MFAQAFDEAMSEIDTMRKRITELEAALRECAAPISLGDARGDFDYEGALREANRRQTLAARAIGQMCGADVAKL